MQLNPQLIQMLAGRLFRTPGINPNEPQPGMQGAMPQTTDPAQPQQPRWMQGLNSPLGQIGLRMLAGSRDPQGNPVGLGPAAGGAVLGYQQGEQDKVHQDLQRQYMQAQIKRMNLPDPQQAAAPVIVMGPDGKPRYATREEAIGQQPYMEPRGAAQGPGELEIAQALNDPNVPEAVKKDLRDLIDRKYRDSTGEPLVAVQGPNGTSIFIPRSQASGMSPAAPRENFVPTEGERTSANYLGRMEAAEERLGDYKPGLMDYLAAEKWMEGGSLTASAASAAMSEKGSKYYQSAADWVRAKLRKESGAVISPQEMIQEIRTYFPMPGDSPAVIEQKREARLQAQQGMRDMSGRAAPNQAGDANDPLGIRNK